MGKNEKPPGAPKIILPNDPMSGEIKITYDLRRQQIDIDARGSDMRGAALALLAAAQVMVSQAFQATGLIVPTQGGIVNGTKKNDDTH